MRRAEALRLYRGALRVGRGLGGNARAAVAAEARSRLLDGAAIARADPAQEGRLLAEGAGFVEQLREMALLTR